MGIETTKTTGAGAMAYNLNPGARGFRLAEVRLHISAAPVAAENFTITANSGVGVAYNVNMLTTAMAGTQDVVYIPSTPQHFVSGDTIDFAYTNSGANTWGLEIKIEAA